MDYLYINAMVREVFKDLPCGCPFPKHYERTLNKVLEVQNCLGEKTEVLSGFSMLSKEEKPVLVMTRKQRHTNSQSVGAFIQCLGWSWEPTLLTSGLDSFLDTGFYSEEEIDRMAKAGGNVPLPKQLRQNWAQPQLEMSVQVRQAVLSAIMLRWLRFDAPLRIAVPADVDYNSYVIEAVRQIWELMPLGFRLRAGFCSYMPNSDDVPAEIQIVFVPEAMADSKTLSLDGSSPAVCTALCKGIGDLGLQALVQYLASATAEDRNGLLEEILEDVEQNGDGDLLTQIVPDSYQPTGLAIHLLTLHGIDAMPQWRKRFLNNPSRFPSRMEQRLCRHIRQEVDIKQCRDLYVDDCRKADMQVWKAMEPYLPFCQNAPDLAQCLWDTALGLLRRENYSYAKIHETVASEKTLLKPILDKARYSALFCLVAQERLHTLQARSVERQEEVQACLREAAKLRDDIKAFTNGTQNEDIQGVLEQVTAYGVYLQDKLTFFWMQGLADQFVQLTKPGRSVEQLEKDICTAQELLAKCEKQRDIPEKQVLKEEIQNFISEKTAFIHSSRAVYQQIRECMQHQRDYFALLMELETMDWGRLDAKQSSELREVLKQHRPTVFAHYMQGFREHFQKELTLTAVAELPDWVCCVMMRDICQIEQPVLRISGNHKAGDNAEKIENLLVTVRRISGAKETSVRLDEQMYDAQWLKRLLYLQHDLKTMGDGETLEEVFYRLVDEGAFSGEELIPAIQMLERCGCKCNRMFPCVMQGKFRGASQSQCRMALEELWSEADENGRQELKELENDSRKSAFELDENAVAAMAEIRKEPSAKKSRWPLIVMCTMGVVILGLVAALVLVMVLGSRQESDSMETTQPTETEIVVETEPVYPEDFYYYVSYGQTMEKLYAEILDTEQMRIAVATLLRENEQLAQTMLERYGQDREAMVRIEDSDVQVSWAEYAFWMLYLHEDMEQEALLNLVSEQDPDAMKILAVIYREAIQPQKDSLELVDDLETSQQPDETTETTQETSQMLSEPETEQTDMASNDTEPEDPSAEETTEPEETRPAPTLEELLQDMYGATDAYEASLETNAHWILTAQLFGADFRKEFAVHSSRVNNWLGEEASETPAWTALRAYASTLPLDTTIGFGELDTEVTWAEFLFWECWVLENQGETLQNVGCFTEELRNQTLEVLEILYGMAGADMVPSGMAMVTEEQGLYEILSQQAQDGFERIQRTYQSLVDDSK